VAQLVNVLKNAQAAPPQFFLRRHFDNKYFVFF
jgi:hypothetical protein